MALVDTGFEPSSPLCGRPSVMPAGCGLIMLMRLWLGAPHRSSAAEGAYLVIPRLTCCVLSAESIATTPSWLAKILEQCRRSFARGACVDGVAGMDVLWFQRDGERIQRSTATRGHARDYDATTCRPSRVGGAAAILPNARGLESPVASKQPSGPPPRDTLWRCLRQGG